MNERKTKVETITLQGNAQYAKVAARSAAFHEDNQECSVETSCEFAGEGAVVFTARVTTSKGTFTGHSFGKVGRAKEFEKLETISVGRALAFAGYLASGDIATREEMEDVVTVNQFNSLKLKFNQSRSAEVENWAQLTREVKQREFSKWCRSVVGEDVDYTDPAAWEPAWFQQCWVELGGVTPDVPFDSE